MQVTFLLQAIKYIDIYGVPVGVNFKSKEVYKTIFGAFISAVIFILIMLQTYYSGQELITRNNPQVITSEQYVRNPERMVFDNVQQVVMMGFNTPSSQYISNSSIIQVSATLSTVTKVLNQTTQQYDAVTTAIPLRIRPCTINDVKVEKLQDFFSKLPLSNLFCFDDNQQIYVEGDYSGDFYSRVDVSFNQCVNSTKPGSVICQPQKQIDKVLSNVSFLVYMIDKILDPNNFEQPFDYQGFNIQAQATNQQSQAYTAYFENYYIESDVGLIQKNIKKTKDFKFVGTDTTIIYNNPSLVIKFSMRPYKNKQQLIQRWYMKLTDLIVQVGGVLKFLTVAGFILCHPYAKLNLTKDVINSVFDFEEYKKDNFTTKQNFASDQKEIKHGEQESFQLDSIIMKKLSKEQIQNIQNSLSLSQKTNPPSPSIIRQKKCDQIEQKQKLRFRKKSNQMDSSQHNYNKQFIKQEIGDQSQRTQLLEQPNTQISKSQQQLYNSIQQTSPQNQIDIKNKEEIEKQNDNKSEQEENLFKTRIINRIYKLINPLKQNFQLKMKDYLSYFSNCSQNKTNLMDKGIKKINYRLDIQNILHQLQEIEKLKKIVLDEDQIKLFEILPRPVLKNSQSKIQTDTKNQFFETKNQSEEEKANEVYNSLCNILNKQKKSQRDLQLIQLLDNNMYLSLQKYGLLCNRSEVPLESKYLDADEVVECPNILNQLSSQLIKSSYNNQLQSEQNQETNSFADKFEIQEEGIKSDFYFKFYQRSKKNSLNLS
ncbi:zinc knuckle protein, putative (macronuclear) [Tetrahymena thermophila SB210]|uniref:Zinc knuckle protein, putative n=1 Tax=Tetrahymena thermophila (strain SB210) TaxID=312017 RepID=Q22BH9_TETTS|nr:zinc knuckle protein, putative [Tetrahymena thermophila SB210]EAR82625.1 zinc knuckle protein, putative [Tetrahymena thermophila SB210]|eukprot:XP_001030288.1 zinc knuckle protein, putative [Tetrahymena thermophila SB210]